VAKKEAEAETEEKDTNEEGEKAKSGSSKVKIIIIAIVLTLVIGGGLVGGTFYFVSGMNDDAAASTKKANSKKADAEDGEEGDEDEEADEENEDDDEGEEEEENVVPTEPALYYSMDPKFVISFSNQEFARFMQFSLEVMSRNPEVIKKIEQHTPVIRSNLLMLFSSQSYNAMVSREGKEKLLKETAADINNTLKKVTGSSEMSKAVEAAYFTSFVIQ